MDTSICKVRAKIINSFVQRYFTAFIKNRKEFERVRNLKKEIRRGIIKNK